MKLIELLMILGIVLLPVLIATGCIENDDYMEYNSPEMREGWRRSIQSQITNANKIIKEAREQCSGSFMVRYQMDGTLREFNIPVYWECTTPAKEKK